MSSALQVVIKLLEMSSALVSYTTPLENLRPNIRVTVQNFERFKQALLPANEVIQTTVGKIRPFGEKRLRILDLFNRVVRLKYESVERNLVQLQIFPLLLDLFFNNFWNNFLHEKIEKMISAILTDDCTQLQIELIDKSKLVEKILTAVQENEAQLLKPKGIRRGYMGYLTQIARKIQALADRNPQVAEFLSGNQHWQNYIIRVHPEGVIMKLDGSDTGSVLIPDDLIDTNPEDADAFPISSQYLLQQVSFPFVKTDWQIIKNEEKLIIKHTEGIQEALERVNLAEEFYKKMINEIDRLLEYKNLEYPYY